MKDLERLATSGSEEDRRLLRAARDVPVPARVQEDVRRRVEERIRRGRWPLALGAFGVLVAGVAAAQGMGVFDRVWGGFHASPAPVVARPPVVVPLPAPLPAPAIAPQRRQRPPTEQPTVAMEQPRLIEQPGLDLPALRRAAEPEPVPIMPKPMLTIARTGRAAIHLSVSGDAIAGSVRGVPVSLTLSAKSVSGRLGGDAVLIHVFGTRQASGAVGGLELELSFVPTDRGHILSAALPDVDGRVELDAEHLEFSPGCNRPLPAVRPGLYVGRCGDGAELQVALPPSFWQLPPLTRLVVLGMILPEPDSELESKGPALFPVTR
jgi:hypothetical protein